MNLSHRIASPPARPRKSAGLSLLAGAACALSPTVLQAQHSLTPRPLPDTLPMLFSAPSVPVLPAPTATSSSLESSLVDPGLPEAPLPPQLAMEPKPKHGSNPADRIAQKSTMTIPSDWHAQRLTAHQKFNAGFTDLYSVQSVASWFLAAGWEQLTNGAPNYGTDKGAFGARLGAAAIRGTSQNVFSEMILAPVLHEDVRYYVEGPKYGIVHRGIYAATRPLIARTDDGKNTINGAVLLGYAGSAALTPTYYPSINRNFTDVARVYGGGIGGVALGYVITEFSEDVFRALHLTKAP